jgi:hypothetical protein
MAFLWKLVAPTHYRNLSNRALKHLQNTREHSLYKKSRIKIEKLSICEPRICEQRMGEENTQGCEKKEEKNSQLVMSDAAWPEA